MSVRDLLRKPTWYKMERLFDGLARKIADVGEHNIILRGIRYAASIKCSKCGDTIRLHNLRVGAGGDRLDLSPELAICVVPMGLPDSLGESLRRMSEANLRMPVVLTTANVHYVNLRPLAPAEAKKLMTEEGQDGTKADSGIILPMRRGEDEGSEASAGGETGPAEG